jgi:lysozyme family protein
MGAQWSRRKVFAGAGASLAALGWANRAAGQGAVARQIGDLLGSPLPQQLLTLVPGEAFEAAGFVRSLLTLEDEARRLALPRSALSLREGEVPTEVEGLYAIAMPRLVALIDRSEQLEPFFAERAGELLARLHQTQHLVPEALTHLLSRSAAPVQAPLGFADQDAAVPAEPPPPQPPLPAELPQVTLPAPEVISEPVIQRLPDPVAPAAPEPPDAPDSVPAALSRSTRFAELAAEYRALFAAAAIRPERQEQAQWHLAMMRQSRPRYQSVATRAGVPWQFVAAIHGMEASFNFRAHFHNGDFPLSQRTRQVPAGRPIRWLPPSDWESSAMDALRLLGFTGQSDWSLAHTLYRLEAFNGFGYRRYAKPSPYLWSFSSLYERGKFVADGHFDPRARSQQCGTATMLKLLDLAGELDLPA